MKNSQIMNFHGPSDLNNSIHDESVKSGAKRNLEQLEVNLNNSFENAEKKKIKMENIYPKLNVFPFPKKEKIIFSKNIPSNLMNEKIKEVFKGYPDDLRNNFEKTLKELTADGFIVLFIL